MEHQHKQQSKEYHCCRHDQKAPAISCFFSNVSVNIVKSNIKQGCHTDDQSGHRRHLRRIIKSPDGHNQCRINDRAEQSGQTQHPECPTEDPCRIKHCRNHRKQGNAREYLQPVNQRRKDQSSHRHSAKKQRHIIGSLSLLQSQRIGSVDHKPVQHSMFCNKVYTALIQTK